MREFTLPHRMHRIGDVDPEARTATCSTCGPTRVQRAGYTDTGKPRWRCATSEGTRLHDSKDGRSRPYIHIERKACERCGFVPEHVCQLDVHHRDGDRRNQDPDNLGVLCANCHRVIHRRGK